MLYLTDVEVSGPNYTEDDYCYLNNFDEPIKLEFYAKEADKSICVHNSAVPGYLHKNYGQIAGVKSFSDDAAVLRIYDIEELQ